MLVQLSHDSITAYLTNIKFMANQSIKWEPLKRKGVAQCRNCQGLMHSSTNCKLPFGCVKCDGNHEPGNCPIATGAEKEKLKCTKCGDFGHPASYKGCSFYNFTNKIHATRKLINRENHAINLNKIYRQVNRNVS